MQCVGIELGQTYVFSKNRYLGQASASLKKRRLGQACPFLKQNCLRPGVGGPRWPRHGKETVLKGKAPTVSNALRALNKCNQKDIDSLVSEGAIKSAHPQINSRSRLAIYVRAFQSMGTKQQDTYIRDTGTLDLLASFESRRCAAGRGHQISPMTNEILFKGA